MDIAEERLRKNGPIVEDRGRLSSERLFFISLAVYLFSYLLMAVSGESWLRFQSINAVWYISFAATIFFFARSSYPGRILSLGPVRSSLILFTIALLLQITFLLRDPTLSQDIMWLQMRGENMVDGKFPYRDFAVNKPPLYIWMVWLISVTIGPSEGSFRIVFVIFNSMIPVVMYAIHRYLSTSGDPVDDRKMPLSGRIPSIGWGIGALAYAMWPVGIMEIGLAGHFDPIVVISVLLSFLFLIRGRPMISGLFLGVGFSLKLYPLLLLPIFLLHFREWRDRALILTGFLTVFLLSCLPVLFQDPILLMEYFRYQTTEWYSGLSVRFLLELLLGSIGLPTTIASIFLNLSLAAGGIYLYYRGIMGKIRRIDLWFTAVLAVLLVITMIIYNWAIIDAGSDSAIDWVFGLFSLMRSLLFITLAVYLFSMFNPDAAMDEIIPGRLTINSHIPENMISTVSTVVLFLLLLCSAQFHPWYLLWIFPFALASDPYISWIIIFMFGFLQTSAYPPWEMGGF